MKFKKSKLLLSVLAFAPLCALAACGNAGGNPTTTPQPTSNPVQTTSNAHDDKNVLDFLNSGKVRIDLFDLDVNVSYGNQALSNPSNVISLSDSAYITFNKNTTANDVYNVIIVAEKINSDGLHTQKYAQIEGSSLLDFQDLIKDQLKGYDRAYVAISKGTTFKWTKGLSAKLDEKIQAITGQN